MRHSSVWRSGTRARTPLAAAALLTCLWLSFAAQAQPASTATQPPQPVPETSPAPAEAPPTPSAHAGMAQSANGDAAAGKRLFHGYLPGKGMARGTLQTVGASLSYIFRDATRRARSMSSEEERLVRSRISRLR